MEEKTEVSKVQKTKSAYLIAHENSEITQIAIIANEWISVLWRDSNFQESISGEQSIT